MPKQSMDDNKQWKWGLTPHIDGAAGAAAAAGTAAELAAVLGTPPAQIRTYI
jgi:hypothetical protein